MPFCGFQLAQGSFHSQAISVSQENSLCRNSQKREETWCLMKKIQLFLHQERRERKRQRKRERKGERDREYWEGKCTDLPSGGLLLQLSTGVAEEDKSLEQRPLNI